MLYQKNCWSCMYHVTCPEQVPARREYALFVMVFAWDLQNTVQLFPWLQLPVQHWVYRSDQEWMTLWTEPLQLLVPSPCSHWKPGRCSGLLSVRGTQAVTHTAKCGEKPGGTWPAALSCNTPESSSRPWGLRGFPSE